MVQRHVVIPADADRLWQALTDPDEAGAWLGGELEWTVEEGEPLRFTPARPTPDEPVREGRVEVVEPGRYLRFRWWPAGGGPETESEVAYVLEPAVDETILTVEETPALASGAASASASASALASASIFGLASVSAAGGTPASGAWTPVDDLRFRMSATTMRSALLVGA
jgi:uncharacterized protein YndB with AHSA1/START domain